MSTFSFDVAYTVHRCCDCRHFCESGDEPPCCTHLYSNRRIEGRLDNDYYMTIHEDCPMRPTQDDNEEDGG